MNYPQGLATVEGEIKLAESELARAKDRLQQADRQLAKKQRSMAAKISEELSFKKAQFSLEQAQSKRKVLVEYTKERNDMVFQSEVKKALSQELANKASWDLEQSKEKKLERQLGLHPK